MGALLEASVLGWVATHVFSLLVGGLSGNILKEEVEKRTVEITDKVRQSWKGLENKSSSRKKITFKLYLYIY